MNFVQTNPGKQMSTAVTRTSYMGYLLTVADEILGQSEPAPPLKQNPMPIDGIVFFLPH